MDLQFFSSKTVTVSQLANFARNSKKIDGLQGIKVSSDVVNKAALDFVGQGGKVSKDW
ncbi:hypothetical protein ABE354_10525 [Brevibacillus laterosporus]|uniref:hypothetical protein n=1 Tax=Brevibacillus laterosporus TaxID=1465 RepID=UPI003D24186A